MQTASPTATKNWPRLTFSNHLTALTIIKLLLLRVHVESKNDSTMNTSTTKKLCVEDKTFVIIFTRYALCSLFSKHNCLMHKLLSLNFSTVIKITDVAYLFNRSCV